VAPGGDVTLQRGPSQGEKSFNDRARSADGFSSNVMNLLCISGRAPTDPEAAWPGALEGVSAEVVGPWEASERLETSHADAVLVRLPFDDWTPEDMLEQIQRIDASVPVILCDAEGKLADAVRLTQLGAFHYMTADDAEQLREVVERTAEHGRSHRLTWAEAARTNEPWRKFLVGESQAMHFEQLVGNMERAILEQALRKTGGNKAQAAGMLRLKRTTLSAKLKSLARTGVNRAASISAGLSRIFRYDLQCGFQIETLLKTRVP
jgi:DNA-binding NtrC family response regulator